MAKSSRVTRATIEYVDKSRYSFPITTRLTYEKTDGKSPQYRVAQKESLFSYEDDFSQAELMERIDTYSKGLTDVSFSVADDGGVYGEDLSVYSVHLYLTGWREPTEGEMTAILTHEAKEADRKAELEQRHIEQDRLQLERMRREHPEWFL